jgi:ATP-dependent DNA helicase DinG
MLEERLWSKACAAIVCSATLKGVGGFKSFLRDSGLDRKHIAQTLEIDSPFDFAAQAKLVVPRMGVSAKDSVGHTKCLIEMVPMALRAVRNGSGALMIFASLKQMREVAEGMPPDVKSVLLVQGQMGKAAMLAEHRRRIEAGQCSVLFGSQSMEEGVDLPGRLCEMVLIAKLPFTVPTGAVETVRKSWIEKMGGNYFREVAVPNACRRLAQEAGRLIRHEGDRGSIVVFDERLVDTPFGKEILGAMPPLSIERRLPGQIEVPW